MQLTLQQPFRQKILIGGIVIVMAGLLISRVLLSIGMILLIANAVIHPDLKANIKIFLRNPVGLAVTGIFFLVLLSGINSENWDYWLDKLRIKLPFLLLPFAVLSLRPFNSKQFYLLHYIFLVLLTLVSLGVLTNYGLDYEEITKSYLYAKVIPTPLNHIRYSIMMAYAIVAGIFLFYNNFYLKRRWERYLTLAMTVFLFVFIHLLAVRSGLVALYAALVFLVLRYIYVKKKVVAGIFMLLLMVAIPVASYYLVPTFQNKIKYSIYDYQRYVQKDKLSGMSDSKRFISMEIGMATGLDNSLIGVGYGDVRDEAHRRVKERHPELPEEEYMTPHNQFIYVFAATGLIGLLIFLFCILYPLFAHGFYRDAQFAAFNIIVFVSFIPESTLEVQLGSAFYIIFLLIGIQYLRGRKEVPFTAHG